MRERKNRATRFNVRGQQQFRMKFKNPGKYRLTKSAKLLNISTSGLAFEVDKNSRPMLGQELWFEFQLQNNQTQVLKAIVRRKEMIRNFSDKSSLQNEIVGVEFIKEKTNSLDSVLSFFKSADNTYQQKLQKEEQKKVWQQKLHKAQIIVGLSALACVLWFSFLWMQPIIKKEQEEFSKNYARALDQKLSNLRKKSN